MTETCDILVIGAGMAGASAAAELAADARVIVLEMERQPGYHSTGRSAATYDASYGNTTIRKLTRASRAFLASPPADIAAHSLLSPRGFIYLARPGHEAALQAHLDEAENAHEISPDEAITKVPVLRAAAIAQATFEVDVTDIDVHSLHQGYLHRLKQRGGRLLCDAGVKNLAYHDSHWQMETSMGTFNSSIVINAAGAWADQVARSAGLAPIDLTPMRRSAAIIVLPERVDVTGWPMVGDIDDSFYFIPESGKLMVSPADETPVEPYDAYPEDMDLALGIDHFEQAVTFKVRRVERKWAGLRTFAPDRSTVVGFDPTANGFFWLAGQGGYGIQTAPAMASLAANLVRGRGIPAELVAQGLEIDEVSPARFR